MIEIPITQSMIDEARAVEAQKLKETNSENVTTVYGENHNPTGLQVKDRFFTGTLGELAFKKLLDQRKKSYVYKPRYKGEGMDSGDFLIHREMMDEIVDVKTAGQSYHEYLSVQEYHVEKYHYPKYIAVRLRLEDDIAEIWGYAHEDELQKIKKGDFYLYGVPLKDCHDIELLLERMQDEL